MILRVLKRSNSLLFEKYVTIKIYNIACTLLKDIHMAASKKSNKTPKTVINKKGKFPSPRKISGGTKSTDNVSKSPWSSIDPVIPVVQLDWKPPSGKDEAKDKYGKGRKVNRKKNGDWF